MDKIVLLYVFADIVNRCIEKSRNTRGLEQATDLSPQEAVCRNSFHHNVKNISFWYKK